MTILYSNSEIQPSKWQLRKSYRFLITIDAYFDDSGTHLSGVDRKPATTTTPERWVRFETEWQAALDCFGIDMFHMTDFAVGAPPYDNWEEPIRRKRIQRLLDIINEYTGASVGVAIPMQAFNTLFSKEAQDYCGGAYGAAARLLFTDAVDYVRRIHPDAWIAYVLESGTKGAGQITETSRRIIANTTEAEHFRMLPIRVENKRKYLPLQAADILAYELFKQLPRQPIPQEDARYPLKVLAQKPHRWSIPNEQTLKDLAYILRLKVEGF